MVGLSGPNSTLSGSSQGILSPPPSVAVQFVSAGLAACIADLGTFPLDTAKVRLQIQGEATSGVAVNPEAGSGNKQPTRHAQFKYRGIFRTVYVISREEGVRALYNGLVAGLQRQLCFASVRIGFYDSVKQIYINAFQAQGLVSGNNIGLRILAGITTGATAVVCAQPTDVVKVRMQAQSATVSRRYKGCLNAYRTIGKEEGMKGLWKGVLPNITRNAVVNASELVSYDIIKEAILRRHLMSDNMPCHFLSAFGAGFTTTCIASPVDVVKTRYMNSAKGVYRGAMNCATTMYKEGGLLAFYKGFMPSFVRLGSWNIAMFVTYEQLKRIITRLTDVTSSSSSFVNS